MIPAIPGAAQLQAQKMLACSGLLPTQLDTEIGPAALKRPVFRKEHGPLEMIGAK